MKKKLIFVLMSVFFLSACEEMPECGDFFAEVPKTTVKESSLSEKKHQLSEYYGNKYRLSGLYNCCSTRNKTFYFKVSNTSLYDDSYNILSHMDGLGGMSLLFEDDFSILHSYHVIPSGEYSNKLSYTYEVPFIEIQQSVFPLLDSRKAKLLYIDDDYMILQVDEVVDNVPNQDISEASFTRLVFIAQSRVGG